MSKGPTKIGFCMEDWIERFGPLDCIEREVKIIAKLFVLYIRF